MPDLSAAPRPPSRRLRRIATVVALVVVAVGCAGGDDGADVARDTVPPATGATSTTATTVPAETTTTTTPRTPASGALRTPSGQLVPVRAQLVDGSAWVVGTPCGAEAEVAAGTRVESTRVVLDPGHGGRESGTISPQGLWESELNLDVAVRVEQLLLARGVSVELTRRTDQQVTVPIRAELARALGPEVLVSIHHNGGDVGPSTVPGTLVFHQADSPASRRLAGLLHERVTAAFADLPVAWVSGMVPGAMAVRNDEGGDYYGVLRRAPEVPAVIVEALYLNGAGEAAALELDVVRQAEAVAIAEGIVAYLTTTAAGSGFRPPLTFADGAVPSREPAECTDPPLG